MVTQILGQAAMTCTGILLIMAGTSGNPRNHGGEACGELRALNYVDRWAIVKIVVQLIKVVLRCRLGGKFKLRDISYIYFAIKIIKFEEKIVQ